MKKAEIRNRVAAQRAQLSEDEFALCEKAILSYLYPLLSAESIVASFKAIPHRKEISLDQLKGIFAFPRVSSASNGTMEMVIASEFCPSEWGIPEPLGGVVVEPTKFDLILIPLLAFDKKGHRVGYGKGFYDRYLALCRPDCLKIGISLFEPVELIEDVESYDIPLDLAVCPSQIYDFR